MGGKQPDGGILSKHIGLPQPRSGDVNGGIGSGEFPVGVTRRMSAGGERGGGVEKRLEQSMEGLGGAQCG